MFQRVIWSPVEVDYLKAHRHDPVDQLCIALSKTRAAIKNKLAEVDGKPVKSKKGPNGKTNIGKRKDCDNQFLRSGWEANLYRVLKMKGELVAYEPTTFSFATFGIHKGTVSYCPDFQIKHPKFKWLEVKGFLKRQDKTKLKRFKKYYPEEFKQLCAVVGSPNTAAAKFFEEIGVPIYGYYTSIRKQYASQLTGWEG